MGWIWSDTQPKVHHKSALRNSYHEVKDGAAPEAATSCKQEKENQEFAQTADHEVDAESIPYAAQSKTTSLSRALTRDEEAEADLQELLDAFHGTSSSTTRTPPPTKPPPSSPPTGQINRSSIHPSALYPTSMSCRAAFDSAFYCQSLGGQFTNLYRYGTMRDCSDQWSNFWFCMRTNRGVLSEEGKAERIQRHYEGRAKKYRVGPSSEDVWEIREARVEEAFEGDLEALEREIRERERSGRGVDG